MTWLSGHPGLLSSTNAHIHTHRHMCAHTHLYSCTISSSFFPPLFFIHSYFLSVLCQGRKQLLQAWMAQRGDWSVDWQEKSTGRRFSLCVLISVRSTSRHYLKTVAPDTHFFTTEGQFFHSFTVPLLQVAECKSKTYCLGFFSDSFCTGVKSGTSSELHRMSVMRLLYIILLRKPSVAGIIKSAMVSVWAEILLVNGMDRDELVLVVRAAPGPHRKYWGQSTEVNFLAGPASLVVVFIILNPVKEGSRELTHVCLISSIECSVESEQRNKA